MKSKFDSSNIDSNWDWDLECVSEKEDNRDREWIYTSKHVRGLKKSIYADALCQHGFEIEYSESTLEEVAESFTINAFNEFLEERMKRYSLSKKDAMISILKTYNCLTDIEKFCRKFGTGLPKKYVDAIEKIVA